MTEKTAVLVGRTNAGKSTLFNRLCGRRIAITSPVPGTTRDWIEGTLKRGERALKLVDTGGYSPDEDQMSSAVRKIVDGWIKRADLLLWIIDGRDGLSPSDRQLAGHIRRSGRPTAVVVNKLDHPKNDMLLNEFHALGFDVVFGVSAAHGRGLDALEEHMVSFAGEPEAPADPRDVRVAVLGRPNVGKSSLVNRLLGAERSIVSDKAGTTRDAVDARIERDGRSFLLVDTAGLRARKSLGSQGLEGITRIMAEKALARCAVAVLLIDATEGLTDGDIAVARLIDQHKRACVIGVNKWDIVDEREQVVKDYQEDVRRQLPFLSWADISFLSAKNGRGVDKLMERVAKADAAFRSGIDAEEMTGWLWSEFQNQPYSVKGKKYHFDGVQIGGTAPPSVVLKGNMDDRMVHFSFRRRVEKLIRSKHSLDGTPLSVRFERTKRA